ncbi:sensor histidine kinase [Candidatus Kaiserbacteria bacterium]|nr:sensor histidine kinase [Candidatus Kaiserbacteria bacterium]
MFFKSLKKEILTFALGLTAITILITTALGVLSTQTAGVNAEDATAVTLRQQAKDFLIQLTDSAAEQQDFLFEHMKNEASKLAAFAQNTYEYPAAFGNDAYWQFGDRIYRENGRYLNKESDISTVFIPNFITLTAIDRAHIEHSAYLDFVAPGMLSTNPNIVAAYEIDTRGISRYYPNIVLGSVAPPDYNSLEDIVYKQATPKNDPEKNIVWSPLYDDPAQRGLMITASAPVYTKDGFQGVVGIDVLLNDIIKTIGEYSPVEGSYSFLVDKDGHTVAFPDRAYRDILGRPRQTGEVRTDLSSSTPTFLPLLKEMESGLKGFGSITSGGKELFVAYAPLKQTGFSMAIVVEKDVMLKAVTSLHAEISSSIRDTITYTMLPISLLILLMISLASFILVTQIVKPVQELTKGAQEIGKGNFDYNLQIQSKDEIGTLAISFNQMSQALKKSRQELYEYSRGLEEKVKERTQELTDANSRQETLLHFVSHEVKSYMTKGMYAFASLKEGDFGPVSPELRQMSNDAFVEMEEGVSTVIDIMSAANLRKGTMSYYKKPFDLKEALTHVMHQQESAAEKKHLAFEISVGEGDFSMTGDEEKIARHVIRNVIDNAIKYTPSGGKIRIELARTDHTFRLSVKDTGVGIVPEDMARLFTEGGKGKDSTKVNVHSTGYGLFVAKIVVEAHGGKIWAESQGPGTGAQFTVEFPMA